MRCRVEVPVALDDVRVLSGVAAAESERAYVLLGAWSVCERRTCQPVRRGIGDGECGESSHVSKCNMLTALFCYPANWLHARASIEKHSRSRPSPVARGAVRCLLIYYLCLVSFCGGVMNSRSTNMYNVLTFYGPLS